MEKGTKMSEVKVNIYTPAGKHVGFFVNPKVKHYPEGDYDLKGEFFDSDGSRVMKLDFNPQALPYTADLSEVENIPDKKIFRVYVQRGRQPVHMTGNVSK
jgi:hypothetical protein